MESMSTFTRVEETFPHPVLAVELLGEFIQNICFVNQMFHCTLVWLRQGRTRPKLDLGDFSWLQAQGSGAMHSFFPRSLSIKIFLPVIFTVCLHVMNWKSLEKQNRGIDEWKGFCGKFVQFLYLLKNIYRLKVEYFNLVPQATTFK